MAITFELWQLITLASMLLSAFSALAWALLSRVERGIERSLSEVLRSNKESIEALRRDADSKFVDLQKHSDKLSQIERDFLRHLAELPVHYVRREDYVRGQTVIEDKLDAIAKDLKMVQIEGSKT